MNKVQFVAQFLITEVTLEHSHVLKKRCNTVMIANTTDMQPDYSSKINASTILRLIILYSHELKFVLISHLRL